MQHRLENTSISFQRPTSAVPYVVMGSAVAALLLVGAVWAITNRSWIFAAIFVISLLGLAVYATGVSIKIGRLSSTLSQNRIDWSAAIPEQQRQTLNIEVRELSKILEFESDHISELQSAYIVAEDLALRQIQHEEGVPLMRHVNVGGVPFDAVYLKSGVLVCCEVSFLVAPELRQDRIAAMLRKISQAKKEIEGSGSVTAVRLMMLLVTQLVPNEEAMLRTALNKNRFAETPVDIDIRLLDFETLQRMYVTE